jgi:hypothetical protein
MAKAGEIVHVEDFLFDDENWQIRYAIVDTRNWRPGKEFSSARAEATSFSGATRARINPPVR